MSPPQTKPIELVYSYSHADSAHKGEMEATLKLLKRKGLLEDWSDNEILPGHKLSAEIREKFDKANIVAFLLSKNFISSDPCMEEWERMKRRNATDTTFFRVPILLSVCPWEDLLGDDDIKILPHDAKSVQQHRPRDKAWQNVYEGIRLVVDALRNDFTPQVDFLRRIESTDLISKRAVSLPDIYEFVPLSYFDRNIDSPTESQEKFVGHVEELLALGSCVIRGPEMGGKTALAKMLVRHLVETACPVLLIDLRDGYNSSIEQTFEEAYSRQFNGDYVRWYQLPNRTIIIDNLSSAPRSKQLLHAAKSMFDHVVVFVAANIFDAYYRDDAVTADLRLLNLRELNHVQQESLIRKRLKLMDQNGTPEDGFVDEVERSVNSIVRRGVVPRWPFYVLAVAQTYEDFMPDSLTITSYGHCYYVFILGRLARSGIGRTDAEINVCLNFGEQLAFAIYEHTVSGQAEHFDSLHFRSFLEKYNQTFMTIPTSTVNRLQDLEYGIISQEGRFRVPYMYYYFLGMYLAKPTEDNRAVISKLCESSFRSENFLTLLFVMHHAQDNSVIDQIVSITARALTEFEPATLSKAETRRFSELAIELPKEVLSGNVERERKKERRARDLRETHTNGLDVEADGHRAEVFRIYQNSAILGQALRSDYGRLTRGKIEEIISTLGDAGLRVIGWGLMSELEIQRAVKYGRASAGTDDVEEITRFVRMMSFLFTLVNLEHIVSSISGRQIGEVVGNVVDKRSTSAYDLIGYFSALDRLDGLTDKVVLMLSRLLGRHDDVFVRTLLSLRTQVYLNTHRSTATLERKVCSLLGISERTRRRFVRGRREW